MSLRKFHVTGRTCDVVEAAAAKAAAAAAAAAAAQTVGTECVTDSAALVGCSSDMNIELSVRRPR